MSRGAAGWAGPLTLASIGRDPIGASRRWLSEAYARSGVKYPNAACLSTVDGQGWPAGRMVLVKEIGPEGYVFYTNYESAKARALDVRPRAALCFHWHDLERQLCVAGQAERVPAGESDGYFRTRPRDSQLGAWASRQSAEIASREALEAKCSELGERFRGRDVPRPAHWGGYRVIPARIEFWQGRPGRLHDRFLFSREPTVEDGWRVRRLSP